MFKLRKYQSNSHWSIQLSGMERAIGILKNIFSRIIHDEDGAEALTLQPSLSQNERGGKTKTICAISLKILHKRRL